MIKVRAWDEQTEEMRGVMGYDYETQEVVLCSVPLRKLSNGKTHTMHGIRRDIDDVTLYRHTGVKDTKGVDIYEGDILRYIRKDWTVRTFEDVVDLAHGTFWVGDEVVLPQALQAYTENEVVGNVKEGVLRQKP